MRNNRLNDPLRVGSQLDCADAAQPVTRTAASRVLLIFMFVFLSILKSRACRKCKPAHFTIETVLLPSRFDLLRGLLEFLDVLGRELRTVDLKGQFVELRGERERHLIVFFVHAGERVGADIEGFVELE